MMPGHISHYDFEFSAAGCFTLTPAIDDTPMIRRHLAAAIVFADFLREILTLPIISPH
jgi:hypothetical protein